MQAGRWQLTGVSALSGTNYIIRRSLVEALGGWDVEALAEDAELSVRIYQSGHKIAYVPYSRSWEQEPETFGVWLRQRSRWARGNNYALWKLIRTFWHAKSKLVAIELLFNLLIPYALLYGILAYQLVFLLGFAGVHVEAPIKISPYFWFTGITLYYLEILLALSYDDEATPSNMGLIFVMYFTYCQIWPLAYIRALYSDVVCRNKREWDKTVRYDTTIEGLDTPEKESRWSPEVERLSEGMGRGVPAEVGSRAPVSTVDE
jgi:cellulose synthase/poly-beta-1,6-N-acetylglucosamine synthase-like glycosyltransferase